MLAGSRPASRMAASASDNCPIGMPNFEDAALSQVWVGLGIQGRVQAQADPGVGVVGGQSEQDRELVQGLRVDQRTRAQRQVQLLVALADPVRHDPLRPDARSASKRQLDGGDHLGPRTLGREASEDLRIEVGLDGVGDQRARQGVAVGGHVRSRPA